MPQASWLGPLEAQRAGQMQLVVVRVLALAGALIALRAHQPRRRLSWGAALGLVLVLSMVWNAAAFVLAALALASVMGARVAFHARALPVHAALLGLGVVAGFALSRPSPPPAAATLASQTLRWIERDNPHRALPLARAWAKQEPAPAEGALALALVARRLGDEKNARIIAEGVVRFGPAALHDRARAFLGRSRTDEVPHE
jgi:hypothetical protein